MAAAAITPWAFDNAFMCFILPSRKLHGNLLQMYWFTSSKEAKHLMRWTSRFQNQPKYSEADAVPR